MSRNKIPYAIEPGIIKGFAGKLMGVNREYFRVARSLIVGLTSRDTANNQARCQSTAFDLAVSDWIGLAAARRRVALTTTGSTVSSRKISA
jgi:hypothetical protein